MKPFYLLVAIVCLCQQTLNSQNIWDAGTQGLKDAGSQGRRDAESQGLKDAGTQGRRDAGTQGRRDAETQGLKDAGSQGLKDAESQGRRDAGTQGRRDAGTQGRRDAGSQGRRVAGSQGLKDAGAQGRNVVVSSLDFSTAVDLMLENNNAIKAAKKNTELARRESQLINASWFPTITMTGTYTVMSNKIGVNQEYAPLLDPLKDKYANDILIPEILNLISNELGDLAFEVPVFEDNFGSIDIEMIYPIFTGVKRIYANKLARNNKSLSEINKEFVGSTKYLELANIYFSLSLAESMIKVLEENNEMTRNHYSQALKMEEIGMFDKAERLIVKVALDESDRSLKSAEKQADVLMESLLLIIGHQDINDDNRDSISLSTPLFINEKYPRQEWFKDMMRENAYIFRQSELHEDIAKTNLKLSRSNYFPVISIFGKQTIASYQVPKNLIPNTIGGINMAWNIFDGLARERNIQQVKIESEIIDETQQNLKNELEVAIDEWYANLEQACINAKDLRSSLELAEEIYKIRKKSFTEGLATSQQVLDALNLLNKTKLLLLSTYYEYDIALANLCCLCGIPEYFESYITY